MSPAYDRTTIARYTLWACAAWSLCVGGSFYWNAHSERELAQELAYNEAVANINKDLTLRSWATEHGGVYVPPTQSAPPNPYLFVPDRDVRTLDGKALTLLNPAYIVRQIQDRHQGAHGTRGRLISLKPLNPANLPDDWEREALLAFKNGGVREIRSLRDIDEKPHYRVIRPLDVEEGCLKCHAWQDYRVGDQIGGISAAVPMASYFARQAHQMRRLAVSHGGLWLVGLLAVAYLNRRALGRLSERKRVDDELRLGASVFQGAGEGICITGPDARILSVNDAFVRITGYAPEEIVGKTPAVLKSGRHSPSFYAFLWTEVGRSGSWRGEIWNRHKMGVIYPAWLSITAVKDGAGKVVNYIGILADITERVLAEQEIRELNESLERRVEARTAELEAINRELESFAFSVSHDLRAPLRAVAGYARLLDEGESGAVSPEGREMIERIRANADRMDALIGAILQFSRVGRAELHAREIDMAVLARSVAEELGAAHPAARIEVGPMPHAVADETMMRQVWANLVGNALKFSSKRAEPRIEIGADETHGQTAFFVRDNGAGFDMATAGRLFGVFHRLHAQHEFPGTGAGLAIVKRIVERHGGRIWAEAAVDHGATFWFTLGAGEETKKPA